MSILRPNRPECHAHQLSLAKTLTDSEINNLAAAVSAAFCYNSMFRFVKRCFEPWFASFAGGAVSLALGFLPSRVFALHRGDDHIQSYSSENQPVLVTAEVLKSRRKKAECH